MTGDSTTAWLLAAAGLLALVLVVVLLLQMTALRRQRRRQTELAAATAAEIAAAREAARAEAQAVRAELAEVRRRADAAAADPDYVITRLGESGGPGASGASDRGETAPGRSVEVAGRIDGRLFADLVLRETLVRVGSVAHGVRHALDPATRNRIQFEMRREVKRARKQRKADLKQARRDLHARQRAQGMSGTGEDAA